MNGSSSTYEALHVRHGAQHTEEEDQHLPPAPLPRLFRCAAACRTTRDAQVETDALRCTAPSHYTLCEHALALAAMCLAGASGGEEGDTYRHEERHGFKEPLFASSLGINSFCSSDSTSSVFELQLDSIACSPDRYMSCGHVTHPMNARAAVIGTQPRTEQVFCTKTSDSKAGKNCNKQIFSAVAMRLLLRCDLHCLRGANMSWLGL
jgi:hypothetical protein